jgi:formamidopyrimidine-DNA glycosylase
MPELPEVETVRRTLEPHLAGRRVLGLDLYDPRVARYPADGEAFARRLVGRRVVSLGRRGKYLRFALDPADEAAAAPGEEWIVHLRMSGRLFWQAPPPVDERFLRARVRLDDGSVVDYIDMRCLGGMYRPDADGVGTPQGLVELGPEALDAAFTPAVLAAALRQRAATVKGVLLDQRTVAGLGNIYVDEALHQAGLNPARTGASLSRRDVVRLHEAIQAVLREGIRAQGVSFSLYRDGEGRRGEMGERLLVYGRVGEPCYACGTTIVRTRVAGRGTAHCPSCQRIPRRRRGA